MSLPIFHVTIFAATLCAFCQTSRSADAPPPTLSNVAYGSHPKQILHFWKADSNQPTSLVFFIHGGGWVSGDRMNSQLMAMLPDLLRSGVSVVSIEYRFIDEAIEENIYPPVKAPLQDAARALQFVRSKAKDWNIDPFRIAACGGSAGAYTSLWLAFHDDLADPHSKDPIARQSTRLLCAAVVAAQTTLDPKLMKEWIPNSIYGSHAFGVFKAGTNSQQDFDLFLARRDELLPLIAEYSPYHHVSSDDPPVYLSYSVPPGLGKPQEDPTHTSNFGVKLQAMMHSMSVECELVYPGAPNVTHKSVVNFLVDKLGRE
jgi:acetyl esterase/lipase